MQGITKYEYSAKNHEFNIIFGKEMGIVEGTSYTYTYDGLDIKITIEPGGYVIVAPKHHFKSYWGSILQWVLHFEVSADGLTMEHYKVLYDPVTGLPQSWFGSYEIHRPKTGDKMWAKFVPDDDPKPWAKGFKFENPTASNITITIHDLMYRVATKDDFVHATYLVNKTVAPPESVVDSYLELWNKGRFVQSIAYINYANATSMRIQLWVNEKLLKDITVDGDGQIIVPFIVNLVRTAPTRNFNTSRVRFRVHILSGSGDITWVAVEFFNSFDDVHRIYWYKEKSISETSDSEVEYTLLWCLPYTCEDVKIDFDFSGPTGAYFYVSSIGQDIWEINEQEAYPLTQYSEQYMPGSSGTIEITGFIRWVKVKIKSDGTNTATLNTKIKAKMVPAV